MSSQSEPEKRHDDRILREREILARSGLSRTTRWRLARDGKFPKPVLITDRLTGVRESELIAWIESRANRAEGEASSR